MEGSGQGVGVAGRSAEGRYRRFNLVLLACCLAGAVGVSGLAWWLEPVSGDLARIGFYAENEYGWRGRQAAFAPPLAQQGRLDGRYDVVVVGESFSRPAPGYDGYGRYWTDYLAARTGLSVGVFHRDGTTLEAVLASPAAHGARLVVVEVLERVLAAVFDVPGDCALPPAPLPETLPAVAATVQPRWRARSVEKLASGPDYLFAFLRTGVQRWVTGADGTKVRRLRLDPPGPFTSRRPDRLLVYRHDYDRRGWDAATWRRIGCRAAAVQAQVVRGGAGFLLMVVPDKTTAYAAHLAPADRTVEAVPLLLAEVPGLALARVDVALRAAIADGVADVYLPDDTHWGSAGAAIAAGVVIEAAGGDAAAE